jgi:hypothetical protein
VDFRDPELPLPFHGAADRGVLAFDRSAGPVSDTWPVLDCYAETGAKQLVHRTFDGWCATSLSEWDSADFGADFTLERYLRQGERHVQFEPDVATAHATLAHAKKRAGLPEEALSSYLAGAQCVPPLPWCDWEALKLAVLLRTDLAALEAASRLATPGPAALWERRETTPGRVADAVAVIASSMENRDAWTRIIDQLAVQAKERGEQAQIQRVRDAIRENRPLPPPRPSRAPTMTPHMTPEEWWAKARCSSMALLAA